MFVMAIQLAMAYHVRNLPWWKVLVVAYTVSGTCNQNLLSAQHEISHFLALKKPFWNKILAVASNCPIVVPVATKFRQYHQEHHSHLVGLSWPQLLSSPYSCVSLYRYLHCMLVLAPHDPQHQCIQTLDKHLSLPILHIVLGLTPLL